MADVCPVCLLPGPDHIAPLHVIHRERGSDAPSCGCDPDALDNTGPCVRTAGHAGVCAGLTLGLCPACRHPWDGHTLGEPERPPSRHEPDPPRPWICSAVGCTCDAWTPYDRPPSRPPGTLVMFACRPDDSAPHPLVALEKT